MKSLSIVILLLFSTLAQADEKPELVIYTYDSFVADWGPGPQVEEAFEAICDCDLRLVSAGDGAGILARLKLEGSRTDADIALGLDTNLTADGRASDLFLPHGQNIATPNLPVEWTDEFFLPYDWGYFAFVYDETRVERAPKSFDELAASGAKIVIQDPRTSTPGLGLMMWVKAVFGARAGEFWESLAPNIVTVTKGWDEAYGMFLEGEADMVLSYTTSPSYHVIAEEDLSKKAAIFDEGHYMQVEVAGILLSTDQPRLSNKFMAFMLSDAFQSIIPTTNWMYPVILPPDGLPEAFAKPVPDDKAILLAPDEAADLRDAALDEWINALSQ